MRRHRGATQELVQVETHSQGGEALHVRAVDELLPTDDMGLEEEKETSATSINDGEYNHPQVLYSNISDSGSCFLL